MSDKQKKQNIDQLMAEADELIAKINSDVINDMAEQHRLEFEQHAQNLDKVKSKLLIRNTGKKETTKSIASSSEGMHEALEDIIKAMKAFTES